MTKDEALKLALEALEHIDHEDNDRDFLFPYQCTMLDKAITAIKQALAAPDLQAELDATNRQVEILSDALAESRREVASLKANAALDKKAENARELGLDYEPAKYSDIVSDGGMDPRNQFDVPPTAQQEPVQDWKALAEEQAETIAKMTSEKYPFAHIRIDASEAEKEGALRDKLIELGWTPPSAQPAVPDAIIEAGESPDYRDGWNDCRAEMLKGKP